MPSVKTEFCSKEVLKKAKSVILEFQLNGKAAYIEEERRIKIIRQCGNVPMQLILEGIQRKCLALCLGATGTSGREAWKWN